ncbi:hypothetical protein HZB89_00640, partial [archaeon]|nr:hypothetical protein [archaeon]
MGKILVYAIPLGVADNVAKAMETAFENYGRPVHSGIFVGTSFSSISFAD